jgi:hypothetical protein
MWRSSKLWSATTIVATLTTFSHNIKVCSVTTNTIVISNLVYLHNSFGIHWFWVIYLYAYIIFGLYVARFSPDDKFSRQRILLKKRFGLLPTQQPPRKYWDNAHFIFWRLFHLVFIFVLSFFLAIFLFLNDLYESLCNGAN